MASFNNVEQKNKQMARVCGHLLRSGYLLEGGELWNVLKLQPGRLF